MLDGDRVFTHFLQISGLEEGAAEDLRAVCDIAGQYLYGRLRAGVNLAANMDRLCLAAAALAFGDYLEFGGARHSGQEVRIGDVTMRESGGASPAAGRMREHFLAGVADLIAPKNAIIFAGGDDGVQP